MGEFDNFSGGFELRGAMYDHGDQLAWHSAQGTYFLAEAGASGGSSAWADITGTPTTLSGYGITDAASDSELAAHAADTTGIHGIADSSALVLTGDSRLTDARTPTAHAASHQNGGTDEILVTGLSGLLADAQTPLSHSILSHSSFPGGTTDFLRADGSFATPPSGGGAHAASHQNGGVDEINVAGLSGLLADGQTPLAHATSHHNAGGDEINVGGLSGVLADPQPPIIGSTGTTAVAGNDGRLTDARTPTAHATSHQNGGTDELNLAGLNGVLADPQPPIIGAGGTQAVAGNDARLTDARTPLAHASSHQNGSGDEISVAGLSGLLADGQTPLVHNILTAHNGFPGGGTTFLRDDGTFASPGAGSTNIKQTTVDFGIAPTRSKIVTVTDAEVLATSNIMALPGSNPSPLNSVDEWDMDPAIFTAYPSAAGGSFTLNIAVQTPRGIVGTRTVNYLLG